MSIGGCATPQKIQAETREDLQRLEVGMTRAQVNAVMGTVTKSVCVTPPSMRVFLSGACAESITITIPYEVSEFESSDGTTSPFSTTTRRTRATRAQSRMMS